MVNHGPVVPVRCARRARVARLLIPSLCIML